LGKARAGDKEKADQKKGNFFHQNHFRKERFI
jgi:hypothetical protein